MAVLYGYFRSYRSSLIGLCSSLTGLQCEGRLRLSYPAAVGRTAAFPCLSRSETLIMHALVACGGSAWHWHSLDVRHHLASSSAGSQTQAFSPDVRCVPRSSPLAWILIPLVRIGSFRRS